jgi:hypothetical protein
MSNRVAEFGDDRFGLNNVHGQCDAQRPCHPRKLKERGP